MKWWKNLVAWLGYTFFGKDKKPSGPVDDVSIAGVKWCKGETPENMPIVFEITNARRGGMGIQWDGNFPGTWPKDIDGCPGAVGFIKLKDGKAEVGAWGELLPPGYCTQSLDIFESRKGLTFSSPLESYEYDKNAEYLIIVSACAGAFSGKTSLGRSNAIKLSH